MQRRTTTTIPEALGIATLCFGLFVFTSIQAFSAMVSAPEPGSGAGAESAIRRIGNGELLSIVVTELVLGAIALLVLHRRKFAIGSLYPQPDLRGIGWGVLIYAGATFAATLVSSPFATRAAEEPIRQIFGGQAYSLPLVVALGLVNGAYEEVFLLGFLQRGLREHGLAIATGVALLVRALCHVYQGPLGLLWVATFGLVLSLCYAANLRLFPVVFAHALADIVPLWLS